MVQNLGPVGRSQHDHAAGRVEPVHFGEDLVERLLALVVTADVRTATGAGAANRVELVDEYDRGRRRLGLLEQIAAPPDAATRRMTSTTTRISNSVGPKSASRLVSRDGPLSGDWASIVTPLPWSRLDSAELSANDGTWVEKSVLAWARGSLGGYLTACLNFPWIASAVEEI